MVFVFDQTWPIVAVWRSSKNRWASVYLCFTGMAADDLPRISSENCHYPFTNNGTLYHGCAENIENVTAPCERWGCFQVNYSAAVCAANTGKTALRLTFPRNPCCDWDVIWHVWLCPPSDRACKIWWPPQGGWVDRWVKYPRVLLIIFLVPRTHVYCPARKACIFSQCIECVCRWWARAPSFGSSFLFYGYSHPDKKKSMGRLQL